MDYGSPDMPTAEHGRLDIGCPSTIRVPGKTDIRYEDFIQESRIRNQESPLMP